MRKLKTIALCAFAVTVISVSHISCRSTRTVSIPRTSLQTQADTLSYALGVVNYDGIRQYLEGGNVLSAEKTDAENALRLNEFFRGVRHAVFLNEDSPYAVGLAVGIHLSQGMIPGFSEQVGHPANINLILAGMMKPLKNQPTAIEVSEAHNLLNNAVEAHRTAGLRARYAENISAGTAFLAENAQRAGVVTLPSGLQYKILREGYGAKPIRTDRVRVHYHGTFLDGTVFDSSIDRGEDIAFEVRQVIQGWTEALQLMSVGSKWRLWIPYHLAYGEQSLGMITPFSLLIFDVELLGIE